MNTAIIVVTVVISFAGIITAVWSFVNTRKKYYDDYKLRKKR